jgi:hypothetical protein
MVLGKKIVKTKSHGTCKTVKGITSPFNWPCEPKIASIGEKFTAPSKLVEISGRGRSFRTHQRLSAVWLAGIWPTSVAPSQIPSLHHHLHNGGRLFAALPPLSTPQRRHTRSSSSPTPWSLLFLRSTAPHDLEPSSRRLASSWPTLSASGALVRRHNTAAVATLSTTSSTRTARTDATALAGGCGLEPGAGGWILDPVEEEEED